MKNLYQRLTDLLSGDPLRVGSVAVRHADGTVTVALAEGGSLRVTAPDEIGIGARVFVQGGKVTGTAPVLPFIEIDV